MSLEDYEIAEEQRIAMDEARKRAEAWMNLQKAYGSNPDDEAKKVNLQKSTGIPSNLMTDPDVRAEAERTHITKSIDLAKSPATAAHLANEENALVSGDMITGMMTMEDKVKSIKSWWNDVIAPTPARAAAQTVRGVSGIMQFTNIGTEKAKEWREAANAVEKQIDLEHPLEDGSWKKAGANALSSMYTQLPFMGMGYLFTSAKVGTGLVLGGMGTQTFGQTYGDRVDAGFGKLESTLSGIWDGSVEVGTEVWGIGTLFKMFKPAAKQAFSKFLVNAGKYFGQDILGELAATALQTSNQRAMARPDMTAQERVDAIGDYFASGDAWKDSIATFKTTLIQSTLMTGMGIGVNRLRQGALPKAEAENKVIMDVLESKELDRLYQRSPENFSDWMQTAGDRHGISKIYLQADRVIEEGLKNGITEEQIPEWLAQYGVSPQELTTAIQTNGNLAMDFGKVALGYKQDKALNGLQKDFLADVNGTSLNQIADAVQEEGEHFERLDELYAKAQANKIGQQDIDTWSEAILNNPELQGRVTTESLMPLIARANMLSTLTNTPAIEHLNRLIQPANIRAEKYGEFQQASPIEFLQGNIESNQPILEDIRKSWESSGISNQISEKDGAIHLSEIQVPKEMRKQGLGTQAMKELTDYADRTGQEIVLTPSTDFGATSTKRLEKFYRQFGFTKNTGAKKDFRYKETMIRKLTPEAKRNILFQGDINEQRGSNQEPYPGGVGSYPRTGAEPGTVTGRGVESRTPETVAGEYGEESLDEYLYHATYKDKLRSIWERGLDPAFAGEYAYMDGNGKRVWLSPDEQFSYNFGDILLRVRTNKLNQEQLSYKELAIGTEAQYLNAISPHDIEVFARGEWVPLRPVVYNQSAQNISAETDKIISDAKANGTYLKGPDGKQTKLTPLQWAQVRTEAFKKWFGDWETEAYNSTFNNKLSDYQNGKLGKEYIFNLGKPSSILSNAGVPNSYITMTQHILNKASRIHGIKLKDLNDLVLKINNPIAVFKSDNVKNAKVIVIDIKQGDNHVAVAYHIVKLKDKLYVNDIKSIHSRPEKQFQAWAKKGLLISVVEKEKGRWLLEREGRAIRPMTSNSRTFDNIIYHDSNYVKPPETGISENGEPLPAAVKAWSDGIKYQLNRDPLAATYQLAGQNIIALFEKSDKSSFLHETAHIFLNDLKYVSENLGVQNEEWNRAKEWLGIGPDGVITREQHERFAEHFEAYLKTGRAPVPEMKGAFRKFKRWLTAIYDHVRSRRSGQLAEIKINPEIADLFDRLLATEQEIETARNEAAAIAILDEQMLSEMGATPEQIKEYLDSNIQADDSARERRDKYKLEDREERVREWKKQAEEESLNEPIYQFLSKARKDGINKESAQAVIGELPDLPGVWRKDGLDINAAFVEYGGFNTIGDLAEAFHNYKPRQLWIEQRVGLLETVHDSFQETQEAIRTSALRRMMEIESQWIAKKLEGQQVREPLTRSAMKAWAEKTIADWGMTKIRGVDRLIAESRRHRQKALLSARQGKWDNALTENERARMTEELISASYRAINNYKKMELRWKHISKWTNDNKNVKVGERFRVQINRVLTQYGIAIKEYDTQATDIYSFASTLASDDIEGIGGITFPEWIGQEFASYKKMSWGKLQELNDVIDCLYGKGREEVEGFKLSDGTKVEDKVNEIIKGQEGVKKLPDLKSDANISGKILQGIQKKYRKFFAMTGILRFIAQRSDGYRNVGDKGTMGPAEKLVQNIVTAMGKSNDLWGDISVKVEPLLKILTKGRKTIYPDITVPENMKRNGMAWTKERVVAACLNMGNEQNLQRLMDGYKLDIYEIRKIASKLTAEEWNAIQKVWDTVNTLWPKIADVHEKINYFRPKKIEPTPITIHTADGADVRLEGGYYPAVYDKDIDRDIARWTEKDDILASHEAILQVPVAKSGFAKGRVQNVKRPLKLSLSVLSTHFNDTIRYITMAEAIRDADRVFDNSELANANTEIMGKDLQDMIRPALKNVIRPDVSAQTNITELIRTRMSVFYLGWNFWTAIQNTTGIFPAMRQVGVGNYLNGLYQVMAHPYASYKAMLEISPYMRLRANNIERDTKRQIRDFKISGIEIKGKTYQYNDVVESGFAMIKFVDTVVSTPAWYGKYQSEMEKHGDVSKAVASADAAVNKAIGSGLSIDTTQFTRHPLLSMIAPFMSFAAVQQEVLATEREAWKSGKIKTGEFLYGNLMTWVMPAVMSTLLQGVLMYGLWGALGGGERKKKKDLWDYTSDLLSYRLMGIPVVRDIFNAVVSGVEGRAPVTSARIPVTEGYKMLLQLGYGTGRVAHDGSEKSVNNLIWSTSEIASMVSGVPVSRVYDKWQRGKKDIERGNGWAANYFIPQEKKK